MNTITVEVKPHHLKGNSFTHHAADPKRRCPLDEALREAGHDPYYVGALMVTFPDQKPDYSIDNNVWNSSTVQSYIDKAEQGSEESVFVHLEEIENF